MTLALTNPQVYKTLTEIDDEMMGSYSQDYLDFMLENKRAYEMAVESFPYPDAPEEFAGNFFHLH